MLEEYGNLYISNESMLFCESKSGTYLVSLEFKQPIESVTAHDNKIYVQLQKSVRLYTPMLVHLKSIKFDQEILRSAWIGDVLWISARNCMYFWENGIITHKKFAHLKCDMFDGKCISYDEMELFVWDTTLKCVKNGIDSHKSPARFKCRTFDKKCILRDENRPFVWDSTLKRVKTIIEPKSKIKSAFVTESYIVIVGIDDCVYVYDYDTLCIVRTIKMQGIFTFDGSDAVCISARDGKIVIIDENITIIHSDIMGYKTVIKINDVVSIYSRNRFEFWKNGVAIGQQSTEVIKFVDIVVVKGVPFGIVVCNSHVTIYDTTNVINTYSLKNIVYLLGSSCHPFLLMMSDNKIYVINTEETDSTITTIVVKSEIASAAMYDNLLFVMSGDNIQTINMANKGYGLC